MALPVDFLSSVALSRGSSLFPHGSSLELPSGCSKPSSSRSVFCQRTTELLSKPSLRPLRRGRRGRLDPRSQAASESEDVLVDLLRPRVVVLPDSSNTINANDTDANNNKHNTKHVTTTTNNNNSNNVNDNNTCNNMLILISVRVKRLIGDCNISSPPRWPRPSGT